MTIVRILHLSDLHFGVIRKAGKEPRPAHWFTPDGALDADPNQLARLLGSGVSDLHHPPDVIVASGDIGWSGSEEDYVPAHAFFTRIREMFPNVPLIIAPGNHDVDRAHTSNEGRQDAFRSFLMNLYEDKEFISLYPLLAPATAGRDDIIAVRVLGDMTEPSCVVVAFNSAGGLQDGDLPVRIDPGALERLDAYLQNLKLPDKTLRICVLHHHLFPFAEPSRKPTGNVNRAWETQADPDLLANSAKFQGWLAQRRFHFVLHGHKHTSHGREDLLWRRTDRSGRRLLVIGAGSAGVEDGHRAKMEPLSFNDITATRLSEQRWQVDINVREIVADVAIPEVRTLYSYRSVVGVQRDEDRAPPIYQSERMDDCHRAIALSTRDRGAQANFLSTVEDPTYFHPATANFNGRFVDKERVQNCFEMLHPEYDRDTTWDEFASYDRRLQEAKLRDKYQFEHGSRLFGSPDRRVGRTESDVWRTSPILGAVNELKRDPTTSKAFVSLYRPDIDVISSGSEPLPGLMSLQFISRDQWLDVTVTFRKLELSFWWCVNMLEVGQLLQWVARHVKRRPGRITFFAALAEWKHDPEAPVKAKLDTLSLSAMTEHVFRESWTELFEMMDEKERLTNDNNLDTLGLVRMSELLAGKARCIDAGAMREHIDRVRDHVQKACNLIEQAKESTYSLRRNVTGAVSELKSAREVLAELARGSSA